MASTKKQLTLQFNAITSEFQANIKKASTEITSLNAKLKLNASELKNDSTNVDLLQERINLLNDKLNDEEEKTENTRLMLEKAKEIYGENSTEVQNLTNKLTYQQTAEQNLRNEIDKVNIQLENQISENEKNQTATEQLKNTIDEQSDELKNLKQQYSDVILEQGEESSEAQELKSKMESLNDELKENKTKLNDAETSSDDFTDALDDLDDSVDGTQGGFTVFKGVLADLTSNGIQAAIGAFQDLATSITNSGIDFTTALSKVEALSGAIDSEMEELKTTALELGSNTKFTSAEVAEAFSYMALAGWDTEEMLSGIDGVLNLAAASEMDLADASDIVTDYLTAFGLSAEDSSAFVDQLTYAMANSNTEVDDLAEAYSNCAGTATTYGYSVEEVTSALMVMAQGGAKGGEAGTALNSIMTRLATNTSGCTDILSQYGIEVYDAQGNMNSLTSIMQGLQNVWGGLTDEEKANLAYTTAGKTAQEELMLVLNDTTGSFEEWGEELGNCNGSAEEMADTMQDNLGGDITRLTSAFDTLGQNIFLDLEEPLRSAVQFVTDNVVPAISTLIDNFPTIATALAGVTVALIANKIAHIGLNGIMTTASGIIPTVKTAFSGLNQVMRDNPVGAVITIITVLITIFMTLWNNCDGFRETVLGLWDTIKSVFTKITSFVGEKVGAIKDTLTNFAEKAGDSISGAIKGVINWCLSNVENVLNVPIKAINGLLSIINKVPGVNIGKLSTFSLPRLKTGISYVPSDYYPAYLDEGERVLTKEENAVYNRVGGMIGLLNSQVESRTNNNDGNNFASVLSYLEIIANKDSSFYVDGQELANTMANSNDTASGELISLRERGLAR